MKEFEVLTTNNVNLILPKGFSKNAVPLEQAAKESKLPFFTFGVPKEAVEILNRYNANVISAPEKERFPKITVLVQSPEIGGIMDLYDEEFLSEYEKGKDEESYFNEGLYAMTMEEAALYKKYIGSNFSTVKEEEKEMIRIVEDGE